jgi:hypothetical protein
MISVNPFLQLSYHSQAIGIWILRYQFKLDSRPNPTASSPKRWAGKYEHTREIL